MAQPPDYVDVPLSDYVDVPLSSVTADQSGARPAMTFAIVNGQRVPLGADEADVLPRQPTPAPAPSTRGEILAGMREGLRQSPFGDESRGALAGMANTVYGAGDVIRRATGMNRIADTPAVKRLTTAPDTPEGRRGFLTEQALEFMVPTGVLGAAGKTAEVAKAAGLTAAQTGGDPLATGASAALTAILPGGATVNKAGAALKEHARETMANSLRAGTLWAKAEAEKLAPGMLERGVGGSLKDLRALSAATAKTAGANLKQAYDVATAAGETVPGNIVRGNLQLASDSLHTVAGNGTRIVVPGHDAAVKHLQNLDAFVAQLPADIPVNQAGAIKATFDQIVSRAGLYGPNVMMTASDKAEAWATREASSALRDLIHRNGTLKDLDHEASFWIGLRDVTRNTMQRKVGQTAGLTAKIAAAGGGSTGATIGAAIGGVPGGVVGSLVGGATAHKLARVLQSTAYMSQISAPMKNALADALASGSAARITYAAQRILASLPAELRVRLAAE